MLLHHCDLLRAEVCGLLSQVARNDEEQLSVCLDKLNFVIIDLADLLKFARGCVSIGVRRQRRQIHSLVRAHQLKESRVVVRDGFLYLLTRSHLRSLAQRSKAGASACVPLKR